MSDITEEDVMKYCNSRNLMIVTKESLEYRHRPIVIETMNKNAIPVEWIEERLKYALSFTHSEAEGKIVYDGCVVTMVSASFTAQVLANLLEAWEKENGEKTV